METVYAILVIGAVGSVSNFFLQLIWYRDSKKGSGGLDD